MSVTINLPPLLQSLAGDTKLVDTGGSTVGECLKELAVKYPQLEARLFNRRGKLLKGTSIFVNGENVHPEPLAHPVRDGDKVHIFYLVQGG